MLKSPCPLHASGLLHMLFPSSEIHRLVQASAPAFLCLEGLTCPGAEGGGIHLPPPSPLPTLGTDLMSPGGQESEALASMSACATSASITLGT